MSAFDNISVEKKAALAYLTVNRPKALNALNKATLEEIGAALEDIRGDAGISGLIVTGAGGKAFVAGADITEIASISAVEMPASAAVERAATCNSLSASTADELIAAMSAEVSPTTDVTASAAAWSVVKALAAEVESTASCAEVKAFTCASSRLCMSEA